MARSQINKKLKMIRENYSLEIGALFQAGNYSTVAMVGDPDRWETYASFGLVGKTAEAIQGLSRFDNVEARFYSAVASWIGGDEKTAKEGLESLSGQYAKNLLALINKSKIKVLAQLSFVRQPPHELVIAATEENRFDVQNIGFHALDLPNDAYADVKSFYDPTKPPDFYFCQMAEWHYLPHNLQELPCPILGQTSDYDAYVQTVYPWLQAFDELVVTDGTEWEDVRRLVRVPVSTFPKTFGITNRIPPLTSKRRDIDVFISGSVFHPFFPEKAILLQQLLKMPGIKIKVLNGFVSIEDYLELLESSKVCFTYYRRSGGTVTRALDALSMGCCVVVQRGSVLNLYANERTGLLDYDFEAKDLSVAISRILNSWEKFEVGSRRGAEIIRREYSFKKIASQYLRFLTFLAAKPRSERKVLPEKALDQKRFTVIKGSLPCSPASIQKRKALSFARWQARWRDERSARIVIDLAREMVLECAEFALQHNGETDQRHQYLASQAIRLYDAGIKQFPQSLTLHFNLIRTAMHFGDLSEVKRALSLAEQAFARPLSFWCVDIMEDVFPWDFYSYFFNYRKYFHGINEQLTTGRKAVESLVKLIMASMYYYASHYQEKQRYLKKAVEFDAEFPFYSLAYLKNLLDQRCFRDIKTIRSIFSGLTERSILFIEAYRLLQKHAGDIGLTEAEQNRCAQILERAESSIAFLENLEPQNLRSLDHASEVSPVGKERPREEGDYAESDINSIISLISKNSRFLAKENLLSRIMFSAYQRLKASKAFSGVIRILKRKGFKINDR